MVRTESKDIAGVTMAEETGLTTETMLTAQDNTEAGAGTAAEEAKATEQQASESAAADAVDEDVAQGAPESYEDFTLPDGIVLSEKVMGEFLPIAKELNLNQEQAQSLINMGSQLAQEFQQKALDAWQEQITGWAEQTRNDKELGGQNLPQSLGVARRALEEFGTPELNQLLRESGIGNHPEMVRFALRIGKAIGNDALVTGASSASVTDPASVMYPTMRQQ